MISRIAYVLFFSIFSPYCMCQTFEWAFRAGGGRMDMGEKIAADKEGNIYAIGSYIRYGDFGSYSLSSYSSTIYLAKFNSYGELLWLNQAGKTQGGSDSKNIAIDNEGNIFVAGCFSGTVTFEGQDNTDVVLSSPGIFSIFLIKYDTNGKILWSQRSYGGPYHDCPYGIGIDSQGNCYITGIYYEETTFGTTTLTTFNDPTTTRPGAAGYFLAKYDKNGNFLWVRNGAGDNTEDAHVLGLVINIDNIDNVFVGGGFEGNINFSGHYLESDKEWMGSRYRYYGNIFFAKYDQNGNLLWIKKEGKNTPGYIISMVMDNHNNFYIVGRGDYLNEIGNNHFPHKTYYIVKYDENATHVWAKQISKGDGGIGEIKLDEEGNIYGVGGFNTLFNKFEIGTETKALTMESNKQTSIVIAKFDKEGNLIWAIQPDGEKMGGTDQALGLCLNNNKDIFITGSFTLNTRFGNTTITAAEGNYAAEDIFIAKIKDDGPTDVSKEIKEKNFNIYPNPSHSSFTLHYNSANSGVINYRISTITGAVVYEAKELKEPGIFNKQINLDNNPPGIYFVELTAEGERLVKKLILVK
jgi:hypothetical protein